MTPPTSIGPSIHTQIGVPLIRDSCSEAEDVLTTIFECNGHPRPGPGVATGPSELIAGRLASYLQIGYRCPALALHDSPGPAVGRSEDGHDLRPVGSEQGGGAGHLTPASQPVGKSRVNGAHTAAGLCKTVTVATYDRLHALRASSTGIRPSQALASGVPVVLGIVLGLFCVGSDYLLRYPWSLAGNVAGTWVLVAFAAGALAPRGSIVRSSVTGFVALVIATLVYYVATSFLWPRSAIGLLVPGVVVWSLVASVAGPLAGAAGAIWRGRIVGRRAPWLRGAAVGVIAAALFAEAAALWVESSEGAIPELLIATAIPLLLLRRRQDLVSAYAALGAFSLVAVPLMVLGQPVVFRLAGAGW